MRWTERGRQTALAVAGLSCCAIGAIVFHLQELVRQTGTAIGPTDGDPLFSLCLLEWGAQAWRHGLAGFWDAPFFFPSTATIALSDHGLLLALLHLILRIAGAGPALGYDLLLVASFPLTAWACFLLLRRAGRAKWWLAAALALAVAFAPWRWGQLPHLMMIWAPGPPLAIWTFDRLLANPRVGRAAAFVAAYAVTVLSGTYLAYLTHFALLAVALVRVGRRSDRRRWLARPVPLAGAAALTVVLGLASFWPYLAARRDHGERRKTQEILAFDTVATDWLAPSLRNLYAGVLPVAWRRAERELFPGALLTAGLLSALARESGRRRMPPLPLLGRALLAGGLFFVLLSSGRVYVLLAKVIPGLDGMRVPTRGQLFVLLAVATLAARGLARGTSATSGRRTRTSWAAGVAILLALDLGSRPMAASDVCELERDAALPPHIRWLARDEVRAIAVFPLRGDSTEGRRMWRIRAHGKPIANGYSSFVPQPFRFLRSSCRSADNRLTGRCVDALDELGISHAVVEDAWYAAPGAALADRQGAALRAEVRDRLRLVFSDSQALVYAVEGQRGSAPQGEEQQGAGREAGEVGVPGDATGL